MKFIMDANSKEELWGGVKEPTQCTTDSVVSNVAPADFGKANFRSHALHATRWMVKDYQWYFHL